MKLKKGSVLWLVAVAVVLLALALLPAACGEEETPSDTGSSACLPPRN